MFFHTHPFVDDAENNDNAPNIKVEAEKILIVRRNTPMILIGNLFGSMPLLLIFWADRQSNSLLLWESALVAILAIRLLHFGLYKPDKVNSNSQRLRNYDRQQMLLIFLTGCIWGAGGWHFFDGTEIKNVAFLILTFVSMIAGSLVSLSSRPVSYRLFASPLMLPLLGRMFLEDEWFYGWMGFGGVVYLLATFSFSSTVHRVIDQSIQLKYENLDLIEDLQQETERANTANREKSHFFAAASHDLRQPLQAVSLYSESLAALVTTPQQQQGLANIQKGVASLHELLDALFDVSRFDAGVVAVNPVVFYLDELLARMEPQFQLEAQIRGLAFQIGCRHCAVRTDPVLLERVLTNLLVNAFRYTEQGKVDIYCTLGPEDHLQLHVRDTGIGITAENCRRIFDEFFQVHNQERDRHQGLGLGLAIVRRILLLLELPVKVHSVLGAGTEFVVTLPLAESLPEDAVLDQNRESSALNQDVFKGLAVMVVDNEAAIVNAMTDLLQSWGSDCSGFVTTEDALAAIEQGYQPALMLVDYRMPGSYSGCELVQRVWQTLPGVAALIITGDTSEEVAQEIIWQQLDFLHKPIKPPRLRIKASRVLARHQERLAQQED
ncbi:MULTISPECIES: hybrid sensor histidine kinase/response regulator [unclassified Oceanobacter]|uniref:ATP-binding response regulator n=2 Tax=Gammaproteobacteria TaxID=1236 RepID=UPI0027366EA2|nr:MULTISPECIES: hybrid sensor histidine kinase/response regulator [unclassified Oceanobacter]MDP2548380.1 hybrid sensor histidine kinase/response regulator [Oceanobacter sp. 4_MG-2023]MDP2608367.1 hybrid sensor histidine kinase/response regulator [Oceanobacter sp. 1_MG-2023]MDP2611462.1 hybrid sensor histidine kinase/response regulator [Oceanobacter sp. 2_MG-2023]